MYYKVQREVRIDCFRNILSPVVVERFTLDTLLEIKVVKEKSLGSLAKTQRRA